jgi:hypothetical protein
MKLNDRRVETTSSTRGRFNFRFLIQDWPSGNSGPGFSIGKSGGIARIPKGTCQISDKRVPA